MSSQAVGKPFEPRVASLHACSLPQFERLQMSSQIVRTSMSIIPMAAQIILLQISRISLAKTRTSSSKQFLEFYVPQAGPEARLDEIIFLRVLILMMRTLLSIGNAEEHIKDASFHGRYEGLNSISNDI
jgi:hypothetical protein